jgi:hypothetical protein
VAIRAIGRIGQSELEASGLETIRLLNHLKADVDEILDKYGWTQALTSAIRSPAGAESLSPQCWRLFRELLKTPRSLPWNWDVTRDVEVMISLEEAGSWETLEVWIVFIWFARPAPKWMEDVERVTLELLLHQPSALPRFEDLCNAAEVWDRKLLQQICDKAQAEPLPPECPSRLWVTVCSTQHPFFLTLLWSSQLTHATPLAPLHFGGDDTF